MIAMLRHADGLVGHLLYGDSTSFCYVVRE